MIPNSSEEYSQCDATRVAIQILKNKNIDVLLPKHVDAWQEHSSSARRPRSSGSRERRLAYDTLMTQPRAIQARKQVESR